MNFENVYFPYTNSTIETKSTATQAATATVSRLFLLYAKNTPTIVPAIPEIKSAVE